MTFLARTGGLACARSILAAALSWSTPLQAERVSVTVEGIEAEVLESVRANLELRQYEEREVSSAEVHRLFERADEQIRLALEPFGYYNARVEGVLERTDDKLYRAVFKVTPGDPVIVREARVEVSEEAAQVESVRAALESFVPKEGRRLDHGAYERSKQRIDTALANEGFLRARTTRRRVEVMRATNSAKIDLKWDAGERYRLGEVRYSESQFPEHFLRRFTSWKEGEFYSAEKLLALQRKLVDAEYFSSVSVMPDLEHAREGVVPVDVQLIPAKRTVYSASLYVSTDSGPGGRLRVDRRWLNRRGHKLDAETEYSPRLQQLSTRYVIPRPGIRNRNLSFGAGYRDEETDTSTSSMVRIAATDVTDHWKGFTRTLSLQYLSGDYEIAERQRTTNLLYAEGLLVRKKADDLYFPLSGYSLLYGLSFASESFASDTSFAQLRAEAKWLRGIGEDGRFIARAALGAMTVDDFDALPPELRFFAGGDRSIRGFDYEQIGEVDSQGGVIGGEYLAVGSAEYEHYFLGNWGAAAFVDAGDAFTSGFKANVGAGIGLRWKSPVGLLRLDIARPVVSDFGDSWQIHLVIGPDL